LSADKVVAVDGLSVRYPGPVVALDRVALGTEEGRCLGIIGESGSGKSTLARVLMGIADGADVAGSAMVCGEQVVGLGAEGWRRLRWRRVAMAFQATGALNPAMELGDQIAEPLQFHRGMSRREAGHRAQGLLEEVGLGAWAANRLPGELSGGQRRLGLIATALACDPEVLILDEPTSGLDPVARRTIIRLLRQQKEQKGMTQVVLSHDIDFVRQVADDVAVLYRGWVAEHGPARAIIDSPAHPYSWGLLNAVPTITTLRELRGIRGRLPGVPAGEGCPFADRCTQAVAECFRERPEPRPTDEGAPGQEVSCLLGGRLELLAGRGIVKSYGGGGVLGRSETRALDGVDFELREGEVLGVLGGNGAGKSTLALIAARVLQADGGKLMFRGQPACDLKGEARAAFYREVQLVQQDPFESISPRFDVRQAVAEPVELLTRLSQAERDVAVADALRRVRLPVEAEFLRRRPHELSGGQLQRISIARALAVRPKVLILDEPVAMLDPSEQAELLHVLKEIQVSGGMAMMLISHDVAVLFRIADRVAVMDRGRVVEQGSADAILRAPQHEFTQLLLAESRWGAEEPDGESGDRVSHGTREARSTLERSQP